MRNIFFLNDLEKKLKQAHVLSPRVEAEMMVTHFAQMDRLDLYTGARVISDLAQRRIEKALVERKKGIPLSHITRQAPFYGRMFTVTPGTLIPRPETELLVEETLTVLQDVFQGQRPRILDLGTGSGCIAVSLTLQYPTCRMTALDASSQALKVARKNIAFFGLSDRIKLVQSRLFSAFNADKHTLWNILVSNPPYVPKESWPRLSREVRSEPRLALDGGRKGLELIEKILKQAPRFLTKDGWLLMEIGKGQSKPLDRFLKERSSYQRHRFIKDLNGIDRVLIAQTHG